MARHVFEGCSIEAGKSCISVRGISKKPYPVMYDKVGTLFKYKSSIRALVSISEELLPKEHKICETSFLDLNDELDAEIVEIYLERIAKFTVQSNFSHVHGIQCSHIKGFTFAKIVIPWKFALQQALIANQTKLEG